MTRQSRGDDGTILLLTLGFVVLALALTAIVVDASIVFLARRGLAGACDSAALAATRDVNENALYGRGLDRLRTPVPLDPDRAQRDVDTVAARDYPDSQYPGLRLTATTAVDGQSVTVEGVRAVRLPFQRYLSAIGIGPVSVHASATARAATD